MAMKLDIDIDNLLHVMEAVANVPETMEKVVGDTMKEATTRAPAWIREATTEHYGIQKSKVKPGKKLRGGSSVTFVYTGGANTLRTYGMKPGKPKKNGYSVSAEILKGKRVQFGANKKLTKKQWQNIGRNFTHQSTKSSMQSPIMLLNIKGQYLPFQRVSGNRHDIKAIKALSTPQTVGSKRTEPDIQKTIEKNIIPRLEHNLTRYINNW